MRLLSDVLARQSALLLKMSTNGADLTRSDSFGEFVDASHSSHAYHDDVKDLRPIEQKLDAQRHERIAEAMATEQAGPSVAAHAMVEEPELLEEHKSSSSSHWSDTLWSKLTALSAFGDSHSKSRQNTSIPRRPSVVRRRTTTGPISGAPGFDPGASPHWNRGRWTLDPDAEEKQRPIPVVLKQRHDDTDPVIEAWHAARVQALLPRRLRLGKSWTLLYSLDQHGSSLATLYNRVGRYAGVVSSQIGPSEGWLRGSSVAAQSAVLGTDVSRITPPVPSSISSDGPMVLAVRDANDNVFGAFVNEAIRISPHYYGNGQCFLWKTVHRRLPALPDETDGDASQHDDLHPDKAIEYFRWSGENDYMVLSESDYLSVGGGDGRYGLWLDDTLTNGISSRCPTYHNEVLCDAHESHASHAPDNAPKPPTDLLIDLDETTHDTSVPETKRFTCIGIEVWAVGTD